MTFNNLIFGALCNYEVLYLFQRTGDNGLRVSCPFRYNGRGVQSPVAALTYICHRVASEEYFHYSPVEVAPRGTHTFILDEVDVEGTWREGLEVSWPKMKLRLSGPGRKNIATAMSGEIWPKEGLEFRYSSSAFFKVYDITKQSNLDLANKETNAYNSLHSLQGRYIPRLYAAGSTWKALKILVVENCGVTASNENMTEELWSQAEQALVAFHKQGFIHGDIRIDNFVVAKGVIKVVDLGACRRGTSAEQAAELAELAEAKRDWQLEKEVGVYIP
ncbi:hypothetical protein TWF481_006200 [Arthrobotrys musiformis]|uniref:Protein kinase domain-containing protein n=1 Tax=Arthrobotrys musiformis TaxID=47236 RepID=A0AAV9WG22_9PEZI